jgi:hypothetical protein
MKKIVYFVIIVVSIILFSSCYTPQLVTRIYEPQKAGVVRYLDAGAAFVVHERRSTALEMAGRFCGGTFRITAESHDSEEIAAYAFPIAGTGAYAAGIASSSYMHIYFICTSSLMNADNADNAGAAKKSAAAAKKRITVPE